MASTNRTFDVAVWFSPADAPLASACARHLAHHQLRVTLVPWHAGNGGQAVVGPVFEPPARASVTVIAARGVSAWLETPPITAPGLAAHPFTLLAPGLGAGDATQLQRCLPGRVWDLRAAWEDDVVWRALSSSLLTAGAAHETQVEPRSSLTVSNLQRMTIRSYDAIAEKFAEHWFDHPPQRELEQFLQRLRPDSTVLDAGCGPGHHAKALADAGHAVIAIDLSEAMLAQARRRVQSVRLLRMNLQALRFGNNTFDAIWCAAAVHHVPRERLLPVLRGFRRVLKPGGLLGLNVQVGRRSEIVERQLDRRFFEYHAHPRELADVLNAAGFFIEAALHGESRRNTHDLNMVLRWSTLYARSRLSQTLADAALPSHDGSAEIQLGLAPRQKVHNFNT
jgi:ubiquinone/menaquinone biosynthesis C-methylase UbiE